MKKLILLFSIIISSYSYSQMAVFDAGANYALGQQIAEGVQQTQQLQQTFQVLKDAKDKVEQVSNAVKQIGQLQNIINEQVAAVQNASKIQQILSKKDKGANLEGVQYNLGKIQNSIALVQKVLSNGFFNMDDQSRIELIENQYKEVKSAGSNIKINLIQLSY